MDNLRLIPREKLPVLHPLKEADKEFLFKDLDDVISQELQDKIWEMIFARWNYYEDFCNQRC